MPDKIDLLLAAHHLRMPDDPLAHEIIREGVERWRVEGTCERLVRLLAGPDPSYALESLGAELGPEFECPNQLLWVRERVASPRAEM